MLAPSTDIVLDTCSILNMINGGVFSVVCGLPYKFYIGPIVYDECTEVPCPELEEMIATGKIQVKDGSSISVTGFSRLINLYNLGDGETECLTMGCELGYTVCTDDGRARHCAKGEVGDKAVIGTIGLLKTATEWGLIDCSDAYQKFLLMKVLGGFLPTLDSDYFCK